MDIFFSSVVLENDLLKKSWTEKKGKDEDNMSRPIDQALDI